MTITDQGPLTERLLPEAIIHEAQGDHIIVRDDIAGLTYEQFQAT